MFTNFYWYGSIGYINHWKTVSSVLLHKEFNDGNCRC